MRQSSGICMASVTTRQLAGTSPVRRSVQDSESSAVDIMYHPLVLHTGAYNLADSLINDKVL